MSTPVGGHCAAVMIVAATLWFGGAVEAGAQQRLPQQEPPQQTPPQQTPPQPPRPFTGLFRGAPTAPIETVSVQVSGYSGYDRDQSTQSDDGVGRAGEGAYTGADAELSYTPVQRGRVNFDARALGSLRYYASLSELVAATQSASAGATFQLSRRMTLSTRGGVDYTPYFDYIPVVGVEESPTGPEVAPRVVDNTVSTRRVLGYDAGADLTHSMTDRTWLAFRYAARVSALIDESQQSLDQVASAAFTHRHSRSVMTRVSYLHRDGDYIVGDVNETVRVDEVEFALERGWARSPTRRTTLSIIGGPSFIDQAGQRFSRAFGGVALTHPYGRSWSLRAAYRRGLQFVTGSGEPFYSNSASFGLSGLVSRRVDVSFSAGAVLGDLGLEGGTTPLDTYSASARFRYGITSRLAAYGEYLYNYSKYTTDATLPSLDRTSLRFGLNLFVPMLSERASRRSQ